MKRTLLGSFPATTVRELIDGLQGLTGISDTDTTYVSVNSDSVRARLFEETLTDGSKVYNVELTEVSKYAKACAYCGRSLTLQSGPSCSRPSEHGKD